MLMEMSFNVNIYIFTFFGEFHVMKYKNVKKGLLLGFLPPLKNNSHLTSLIACRCEGFLVLFFLQWISNLFRNPTPAQRA